VVFSQIPHISPQLQSQRFRKVPPRAQWVRLALANSRLPGEHKRITSGSQAGPAMLSWYSVLAVRSVDEAGLDEVALAQTVGGSGRPGRGGGAVVAVIVRGWGLAVAVVFLMAAVHKVEAVRAGRAATQPLFAHSPWRRRHAGVLLAAVATVEALAVLLLAAAPTVGLGLAVVLLAVYTAELRRLRPDQDCDCFGPKLTADRAGALRRNVALLLVSMGALVALLAGAVPVAGLSQAVVGTALLQLAAILALVALQRLRVWTTQRQSLPHRTQQASSPLTDPGRKERAVRT
jgi:hypothetical protein